jgi:hypothetical protein
MASFLYSNSQPTKSLKEQVRDKLKKNFETEYSQWKETHSKTINKLMLEHDWRRESYLRIKYTPPYINIETSQFEKDVNLLLSNIETDETCFKYYADENEFTYTKFNIDGGRLKGVDVYLLGLKDEVCKYVKVNKS